AFPADQATFSQVARLDADGQKFYWQELATYQISVDDLEVALPKLVEHGRPHAAVDLASHHEGRDTVQPDLLAAALSAAARTLTDCDGLRSDSYEIGKLLDA